MKKSLIIGVILLVVLIQIGWYLASPLFLDKVVEEDFPISDNSNKEVFLTEKINEEVSSETSNDLSDLLIFEGDFMDADFFHKVSGKAMIVSDGKDNYLRFEDFKSTNGPDLKVYLSEDLKAKSFISLGDLKGNIGNQNYLISEDIDFNKYNNVLIWCERFGVLFGNAELK